MGRSQGSQVNRIFRLCLGACQQAHSFLSVTLCCITTHPLAPALRAILSRSLSIGQISWGLHRLRGRCWWGPDCALKCPASLIPLFCQPGDDTHGTIMLIQGVAELLACVLQVLSEAVLLQHDCIPFLHQPTRFIGLQLYILSCYWVTGMRVG